MRRFEIGPLIVAVGSLLLLVSLFLDWYAGESAWGAFEVADVLVAALALAALVVAVGVIAEHVAGLERRWLPAIALAATLLVVAELISPPPVVGDAEPQEGAWIAFAAALVMLVGTVLSLSRVSFSFAIEGREPRRVAAVDHRPPPTEAGAPVPRATAAEPPAGGETTATEVLPEEGGKNR